MLKKVSKILLVDDDLAINYFHKRLFAKAELGETITPLFNGVEALNELVRLNGSLTTDTLMLIFLDINMPVLDGWGFLDGFDEIYDKLNYKTNIIVLSSSINPDDIEKAKHNKYVSEYLTKPLTLDNITELKKYYF
jgi:CheY-like chemotaxis protein